MSSAFTVLHVTLGVFNFLFYQNNIKQTAGNAHCLFASKKHKPKIKTFNRTLSSSPIGKKCFITLVEKVKDDYIRIMQLEKPVGSAGFM